MPINNALLVAAPVLQNYLVDKDTGFPLAGGIITLYKDSSRQVLKNWYYQTGTINNYQYIPLDNPMHLSSVGTITDPNGNQVIPFFYPYVEDLSNTREAYYITVYSSDINNQPNVLQFTLENFPFPVTNASSDSSSQSLQNYIINGGYWRNYGLNASINVPSQKIFNKVIAPSQHDGFNGSMDVSILDGNSDIRYLRVTQNSVFSEDTVEFISIPPSSIVNDVAPEYAIRAQCILSQTGEVIKCIQYPIALHLDTLAGQPGNLVFYARNSSSSQNASLDLYIAQYCGQGNTVLNTLDGYLLSPIGPDGDPTIIITENGETFQQIIFPFIFPDVPTNGALGPGGDDALFLWIQYPLSAAFEIDHTKPQIYVGTDIPSYNFQSYDEINAVISSPRTGDYRQSINAFYNYGWVPLDDGTIGSSTSGATTRASADTYQLYYLIWNNFINSQNFAPMYKNVGSGVYQKTSYSTSAILDFEQGNQLSLTRNLGSVLSGAAPTVFSPISFTIPSTPSPYLVAFTSSVIADGTPIYFFNIGGALPVSSPQILVNTAYYAYTSYTANTVNIYVSTSLIPNNSKLITYVDQATTANLNAAYVNGASGVGATLTDASGTFAKFRPDGIDGTVGYYYLIKNQTNAYQNGIYQLTTQGDGISINWVLTRATYYDQPNQINPNDFVYVVEGTTNSNKLFFQTSSIANVGIVNNNITFTLSSFTFISFTGTGSGTNYLEVNNYYLSTSAGMESTTLSISNLPNHKHDPLSPATSFVQFAGSLPQTSLSSGLSVINTTEPTTGGITGYTSQSPVSNFQPTNFVNFFMKL